MMRRILLTWLIPLLSIVASVPLLAQHAPRVLIVDAHPDDEIAYAVTVYRLTHELDATVDLLVITNGEAGFKYSTLAEAFYGVGLTDEAVGRANLPRIRKQEQMNAGRILGLRDYFFLDQCDNRYTLNQHEVLDSVWDLAIVRSRLDSVLKKGRYDYVLTLIPSDSTHGHHKAATILALEAVNRMPVSARPIVLAGASRAKNDTVVKAWSGVKEYPLTKMDVSVSPFILDRTTPFGYNKKLNWSIISNWIIAEHKSQGALQMDMDYGDVEYFYYYDMNPKSGVMSVSRLFDSLKRIPFKPKTY